MSNPSPELFHEVQLLLAQEARLLQSARYEEWLAMFSEDLRYWMPLVYVEDGRDAESERHELGHFDDTLETLSLRVRRMQSKKAWTEIPPSRVRYFFYPIHIEEESDGQVMLETNFIVYQTRLQREENIFGGCRYDSLRRVDGRLKIYSRRIIADRVVLPANNLTVFF